jgi:dTDP-4-amino-4,6-dideoxygalactose transaminase
MAVIGSNELAIEGGAPVRDSKSRPWPVWPSTSDAEWREKIEPAFRRVYESQAEGVGGREQKRFARRFADYCGVPHCVLVAHGTDALATALAATLDLDGIRDGGEVIVPNYTFIASASAALDMQCSVVLTDIDPKTFTLCPAAVERAVRPGRTRAIMVVHIAGQPCDMNAINAIARKHGLTVVEDCAQAHGALHEGARVGSLGDVAGFSFQSSKNLCSGEGGCVTTRDIGIFNRSVGMMNSGRLPAGERWNYARIGWNYRPSEYVAALLTARLDDLEQQSDHRTRMAEYLTSRIENIPGVTPPANGPWCSRHDYHLYCILIDEAKFGGRPRNDVVDALQAEGIPAMAGYTEPLSEQPGMRQLAADHPNAVRVEPCPATEEVCRRSVWIAGQILLAGSEDMDEIATALAKVQSAFNRRAPGS